MTISDLTAKAESLGLHLMQADIQHIRRILPIIPYNRRQEVLSRYLDLWHQILVNSPDAITAMNTGRKAANTYLLEFV